MRLTAAALTFRNIRLSYCGNYTQLILLTIGTAVTASETKREYVKRTKGVLLEVFG
jgi:hypothetical protein